MKYLKIMIFNDQFIYLETAYKWDQNGKRNQNTST